MTTASSVPVTVSHQGTMGGKVRAISQAVTMAERSVRKSAFGLPRMASMAASPARAAALAMASWTRMPAPKNHT